jgi:O-antigen ligase
MRSETAASRPAGAGAYPLLRHETPAASVGLLIATALFGMAIALGFAVAVGEAAAFLVALAVVCAVVIMFDFRIGAVLLIMLMPLGATFFMPHSVLGVPALNPFNIVLLATLLSCVMHRQLGHLVQGRLIWLYVAPILAAGVLGMPHALDLHRAFLESEAMRWSGPLGYFREMAVRPLLIVAAALLVGAAAARSEKPERFLIPMMASIWLLALLQFSLILASGVHIAFLATPASRAFYDQMGLHANDLGRLFAVAYALFLFVWWETKQPGLKAALLATMGVASLAMVLSFSRGAFFGFFLVNALFLVWKFNARTLGLALLAGAIVAALAPGYLWGRLTFGFDSDLNSVSADRIEGIWLPLLPELWKSPLWGNGLGSTMWSFPMLTDAMLTVNHPHSAYLEALLDMGVIGLALMLAYFWHVWRGFRALGSNPFLRPEMRGLFQGATAALIFFFVTGWVGSSFRPDAEFGFMWLAIGLMYGVLARNPTR